MSYWWELKVNISLARTAVSPRFSNYSISEKILNNINLVVWRPVKQETSSLSVSDHGTETLRVYYTLPNMNIVGLWLISIWFTWSFIKLFAWYNLYVFDNNFVWVLFLVRWRTSSGQTTSRSSVRHFGCSSVSVSMQTAPSKILSPQERVRKSTFKSFSIKLLYKPIFNKLSALRARKGSK